MISRVLLALGLTVLMVVTGITSYVFLGSRTSKIAAPPQNPVAATPRAFTMSGTLYVAQDGAIYSLNAGRFHQLTPEAGWMQPSLYPDGSKLLAVKRSSYYSDVYILSKFGQVLKRVTNNAGPPRNTDTSVKHWAFYPRLARDGKTMYMSYDDPKYGYEVDLSVWSMPVSGNIRQGRLWTIANGYSGGDMQPVPTASGSVIYTKYLYGSDTKLGSQIWLTSGARSRGKALTTEGAACAQPALSPNGKQVAMICTYGKQTSRLVIASFNGSSFGPLRTLISDQMVAQPTWAPDGSGIAYLAPAVGAGPFQLWFLPSAAYAPPPPSPSPQVTPGGPVSSPSASPSPTTPLVVKPIQVTTNLGFDATSAMAWRN